jgi:hypothetical protein
MTNKDLRNEFIKEIINKENEIIDNFGKAYLSARFLELPKKEKIDIIKRLSLKQMQTENGVKFTFCLKTGRLNSNKF